MSDPHRQIESPGDNAAPQAKLSALPAPVGTPAPTNGGRAVAGSHRQPRRLGTRAALNRARTLRNGQALPPHKEAVLAMTARMMVLFENQTARAYHDGEMTEEGEVRQIVSKTIPDYFDRVSEGLRYVFGEGEQQAW